MRALPKAMLASLALWGALFCAISGQWPGALVLLALAAAIMVTWL